MDFSYHKKLGPIVGVVLALACVETIVLHIIAMAYWGWTVAILIGLLDLSLVAMLVQMYGPFANIRSPFTTASSPCGRGGDFACPYPSIIFQPFGRAGARRT